MGGLLAAVFLVPSALALTGCSGCRAPGHSPVTSMGTVVFAPSPGVDARTFLRTQQALLDARGMSDRVSERLGLPPAPHLVSGRAREGTWLLEVRGHHPDPDVSRRACNAAMDLFLTERQEQVRAPLIARQRALAERLDGLPADAPERATLRHELDVLALQLTGAPADAHVLEPCRNL